MTKTPDNDCRSPVFAVYYENNFPNSPKEVFLSVKEATKFVTSPEAKSNGARFKRFSSSQDALNFLASGDACVSPMVVREETVSASEPGNLFPSVDPYKKTVMKKHVEKNEVEQFCALIDSNPRYLINTSGDTATIIMEGFRFNILHIAAKSGKIKIITELFKRLNDVDYYLKCYGTSKDDVLFRRENILRSYLNTPDKGSCETPLHMAAKFGHRDVVRVLLSQHLIEKVLKNNQSKLPADVICERYKNEDVAIVKKEIELLLKGWFVALYRNALDATSAKIFPVDEFPKLTICDSRSGINSSPDKNKFNLAACAGPFISQSDADMFYKKWTAPKKEIKEIKLSDGEKGHERIGRQLAKESNVPWNESWFFVGNRLLNLEDNSSLDEIEDFFRGKRLTASESTEHKEESVNRRLSFGSVSDEDEDDDSDSYFEDALEYFNDSLDGVSDDFAKLTLNSPLPLQTRNFRLSEEDRFITPPSSPPPIFILEEPTKCDNDLFLALNQLEPIRLEKYPITRHFMRKIASLSVQVRTEWPTKDSPRRNKASSRRPKFLFD